LSTLFLWGGNFNYPALAYGRSLIKPSYQAAGSGVFLLSIFYLNKHFGNVLKIIIDALPLPLVEIFYYKICDIPSTHPPLLPGLQWPGRLELGCVYSDGSEDLQMQIRGSSRPACSP
jgi:hypothetical protein